MNRKNIPLILMLTAGACTCIVTMVQAYSVLASLVALFAVMLLFYCLGNGVRLLLDRFDRQNEEKAKQEHVAADKKEAIEMAKACQESKDPAVTRIFQPIESRNE